MVLNNRQKQILDFIRDYVEVQQIAPTVREIARWIGAGPTTIRREISRLVAAGRLRREPGGPRSLWVVTRTQPSPAARISV